MGETCYYGNELRTIVLHVCSGIIPELFINHMMLTYDSLHRRYEQTSSRRQEEAGWSSSLDLECITTVLQYLESVRSSVSRTSRATLVLGQCPPPACKSKCQPMIESGHI